MIDLKSLKGKLALTALAAATAAAFHCHGATGALAQEDGGATTATIGGSEVEVSDVDGSKYVSLEKFAKSRGYSIKYFADSKMYKVVGKDKKEIKFVLNKRAVVVDDKYFKSKDPVIKSDEEVQVPLEMLTAIYGGDGEAKPKPKKDKKEEKKEAAGAKGEKTAETGDKAAGEGADKAKAADAKKEEEHAEEIVVEDDSADTEDVKIVIGDKPAEAAATKEVAVDAAKKPDAAKAPDAQAPPAPAIEGKPAPETAAARPAVETAETAIAEKPKGDAVIENVKYRRNKDSFELDVTFDREPSMDDIKCALDSEGTGVDIRINRADSKLDEQNIKIKENMVKNVKLAMAGSEKAKKVILSISSGEKVKVSSSVRGNTVTFVMTKPDAELAPVISEDGTSPVSVSQAGGDAKKPAPPPDDPKSKGQVEVKVRNLDEIIAPVKDLDYIVTINAGHGGEEFGVVAENRLKEKDLTLDIARRVKAIMDKTKMRALLVRSGDYFMPLENRLKFINTYETKVHVSIHVGGAASPQSSGVGIYYNDIGTAGADLAQAGAGDAQKAGAGASIDAQVNEILMSMNSSKKIGESRAFAEKISEAFKKRKSLKLRKARGAQVAELSDCMMPAVLVETGFLTSRDDEKLLSTEEGKDEIALAIFEGIRDYVLTIRKK